MPLTSALERYLALPRRSRRDAKNDNIRTLVYRDATWQFAQNCWRLQLRSRQYRLQQRDPTFVDFSVQRNERPSIFLQFTSE